MAIPLLLKKPFENKTILLRTDFNISFDENHHVANSHRIKQALPTIKLLLKNNNKIRIISHLGRPTGIDPQFSLLPVVEILKKQLPGIEIIFAKDFFSTDTISIIQNQTSRQIILFENIRFFKEEQSNNQEFSQKLASHGDIYVNDAFSCSHREHASIVGIPKYIPSYAGLLIEHEIEILNHITNSPEHPFIAIIGGGKVDKINILQRLATLCDTLLIGGKFIQFFQEQENKETLDSLKNTTDIIMPIDTVEDNGKIVDIGTRTMELFEKYILSAKTILWNGPMGIFEDPRFQKGTLGVLNAIAQNKTAFSVVGGGDTITAISNDKHKNAITHISTGGGAMLEYIENGTLVGIEALKRQ